MKRYLFLSCVVLLAGFSSSVLAQISVGVAGGYTRNYLYTNAGYRAFTQYQSADGFSVSIPVQYVVNDWLAVQTEAQFAQKNYRLTRSGYYEGIYNAVTNQYLQLPIMGHFSFGGKKLKGFLNLGGYVGYWETGASRGVTPNIDNAQENATRSATLLDYLPAQSFNESYTFDSRRDRRAEVGLLAGIGISYQAARYTFFIEERYAHALLDQQKKYMINQVPRYNQTYTLQIGGLYQLKAR